jgi:uncharacterized protein YbjT (DUF2867 family)
MVLVTGAAGKTGRTVVQALAERGVRVRALVFREEDSVPLRRLGATEVVAADMRDAKAFNRAASGVRAIYHICPNVHPEEVEIGEAAIAAARSSEVERFVYHSVLLPAVEAMPHHWLKYRVEKLLAESGVAFTALQPCAYMQNVLAQWDSIAELGRFAVPYGIDVEISLVDLADVAEAAAIVLTTQGRAGATYELCGPEAISPARMADSLGRHLGRPVRAEEEDVAAWARGARSTGLDEYRIDALVRMFGYYDRRGFTGSPDALAWLLGRGPATFDDFVARTVAERSPPHGGRSLPFSDPRESETN